MFCDDVLEAIELGVERVDLVERELATVGELQRRVELAALEHGLEDAERRRPCRDRDLRAGLGEGLGDREPEATVVGDARDERALAREIDVQHARQASKPARRRANRDQFKPTTSTAVDAALSVPFPSWP